MDSNRETCNIRMCGTSCNIRHDFLAQLYHTCSLCEETFADVDALTLHLLAHGVLNTLHDKTEAPNNVDTCREQPKESSSFQQDMPKSTTLYKEEQPQISAVSKDEVIDLTDEVESKDHSEVCHFQPWVAAPYTDMLAGMKKHITELISRSENLNTKLVEEDQKSTVFPEGYHQNTYSSGNLQVQSSQGDFRVNVSEHDSAIITDTSESKSSKKTEGELQGIDKGTGINQEVSSIGFSTGYNGDFADTVDMTGEDEAAIMSDGSEDTDEEVYECRICGNSFSEISNLLAHVLAHRQNSSIVGNYENMNHSENIQNGEGPSTASGIHNPQTRVIKADDKPKGDTAGINENSNQLHTDKPSHEMVRSSIVLLNGFPEVIDLTDEVPSESRVQDNHSSHITDASKDMVGYSIEYLQNYEKGIEDKLELLTEEIANHYPNNNLGKRQGFEKHIPVDVEDMPYVCNTCGKEFKKKQNLQQHLIVHSKERPYKCVICRKGFKRKDYVKVHMATHTKKMTSQKPAFGQGTPVFRTGSTPHFQPNSDKCKIHGKGFKRMTSLYCHNNVHSKESLHKCMICRKGFMQKYHLDLHMEMHATQKDIICQDLTSQRPVYKCMTCGRIFKTLKIGLSHANKVHSKKRPHKCLKCRRIFKEQHHLRRHVCKHRPIRRGKYVFHHVQFPAQSSMLDNYQQQVTQPSTLDNYQQQLTQPSTLDNYQQQLTQPYTVHEYQQQVTQFTSVLNTLHDARLIETGSSTSTTNYNDVPMTEPTLLPTPTSENGTVCENGSKHEEGQIPLPQMPDHIKEEHYKCSVCEKKSTSEVDLQDHMTTHTKSKLFKCDVCDMAFKTQFMLTIHESSHREGLPYRCSQCGRGFNRQNSLEAHIVEHPVIKLKFKFSP